MPAGASAWSRSPSTPSSSARWRSKQIKSESADDPDSRARFLLEAEVTGRLEHPGIVPVYGLGFDDQGRPYYAMRFVRGITLDEAIATFHKADAAGGRDPRERTLELRQLLGRFVSVCHTMAYAHSRGVLHRDLKPANVLLGPYNETLIVDWGLAKVLGRAERADRAGARGGPRADRRSGSASGPPASAAAPGPQQLDRHRRRGGVRHSGVHEPRAGRGEPRPARPAERRVQPGRDALHPALRQARLRVRLVRGHHPDRPGQERRVPAAAAGQPAGAAGRWRRSA